MDSIEKAREAIRKDSFTNVNLIEAFGAAPDALVAETLELVLDVIESELNECYMLLPVDADGVPIHLGDYLESQEYGGKRFQCRGISVEVGGNGKRWTVCMDYDSYSGTSEFTSANSCRHVEQRTLEDVLFSFWQEFGREVEWKELEGRIGEYAVEIRELIGVNE